MNIFLEYDMKDSKEAVKCILEAFDHMPKDSTNVFLLPSTDKPWLDKFREEMEKNYWIESN